MSIRNNLLGGTDFTTEGVNPVDLNDTFDVLAENTNIHETMDVLISGLDLTEEGTPSKVMDVSTGVVRVGGTYISISATTATFTDADGSNPRWDIVSIDSTGALTVTDGTAASSPVMPAIPSNEAVIAAVYRITSDNTITNNDVVKFWNRQDEVGLRLIYEIDRSTNATSSVRFPMPNGSTIQSLHCKMPYWECRNTTSGDSKQIRININDYSSSTYWMRYFDWDADSLGHNSGNSVWLLAGGSGSTHMSMAGEFTISYLISPAMFGIRANVCSQNATTMWGLSEGLVDTGSETTIESITITPGSGTTRGKILICELKQ